MYNIFISLNQFPFFPEQHKSKSRDFKDCHIYLMVARIRHHQVLQFNTLWDIAVNWSMTSKVDRLRLADHIAWMFSLPRDLQIIPRGDLLEQRFGDAILLDCFTPDQQYEIVLTHDDDMLMLR